jgi:hypothetical protein
VQLAQDDLDAAVALDRQATGEDRGHIIRAFAADGAACCLKGADGSLRGFVIRAPWGGGATVAASQDDAIAILEARRAIAGPEKRVRAGLLAENRDGLERLMRLGWQAAWTAPRLVRGEPFEWRPDWLWGSSTSRSASSRAGLPPQPFDVPDSDRRWYCRAGDRVMVRWGPDGRFFGHQRYPQRRCMEPARNVMLGTILDRARRHLLGDDEPEPAPIVIEPEQIDDVVVALVRPDLDRFASALAAALDPQMPRPDSPALLAGALMTAIDRIGGQGHPVVTRSPAGLYTPEYWHVRINGADARSRSVIARLAAGSDVH